MYQTHVHSIFLKKKSIRRKKTQTNPNMVLMGSFSTPFSPIDRSPGRNETEMLESNGVIKQVDLAGTHRTLHTNTEECTFFSQHVELSPKLITY